MTGRTLLSTISLSVGYGNQALLEDLNLAIHSHQLICFMGPNGSGKSTLLRTLAGLQPVIGGTIKYEAGAESTPVSSMISVVLTDRVSAGYMSAHDLIRLGRYPYLNWRLHFSAEDKKLIDAAIEQTQTGSILNKKLSELSDGQLQMVMIARALAQNGDLLLLDEPTAHLDLDNRLEIMTLLRRLAHENGKGVLVTTHDLHLALQTADDVWLAGDEKKLVRGIPEDLVLDGAFDRIFQFKGFDLRSGRIKHTTEQGRKVKFVGEGSVYLWTKNALERSGFEVGNDGLEVAIRMEEGKNQWLLQGQLFDTVEDLLNALRNRS